MKTKNSLLIFTMGLIISTFGHAQTLELTFTAENNNQHVMLDSIFIENLTQGEDTTLYAPDTVLVLNYITSIGNIETIEKSTFSVTQNYPNPFIEKTEVDIYLPKEENIKVIISDILGRELTYYENKLMQGTHSFTFYSAKEKHYLFTVVGEYASQTIIMLNSNSNTTNREKCSIVYHEYDNYVIGVKSQYEINDFVYNLGDSLEYTGYATNIDGIFGSAVIGDKPEINTNYVFSIMNGLRCPGTPKVTDADGNVYNTIQIGDQCWLRENLRVGIRIDGSEEMTNNSIIEKYCSDDDPTNCEIYGGLYQWDEMMQYETTEGVQGICPDGWYLPTDDEWRILTDFLGVNIAGGKMKETGTTHWYPPNTGATNSSGFTGLAGGYRINSWLFGDFGYNGNWWSSTELLSGTYARGVMLSYNSNTDYTYSASKTGGHSLRCLKN